MDILITQLELSLHTKIIYHLCNECCDPILYTDYHINGEQCQICDKWYCTKEYNNKYCSSCAYKYLFGIFFIIRDNNTRDTDNDGVELICLQCINNLVSKDKDTFCSHILDAIKKYNTCQNMNIVYINHRYCCEECEAIDKIVVYI